MSAHRRLRSTSRQLALEPRLLFDGAAAVATEHALDATEERAQGDTPDSAAPAGQIGLDFDGQGEAGNAAAVVLIDSRVPQADALAADLQAQGASVHVVAVEASGMASIRDALGYAQSAGSLHIISYASDSGATLLGTDSFSASSLAPTSEQVQAWAYFLAADADIQLYGSSDADLALQPLASTSKADIDAAAANSAPHHVARTFAARTLMASDAEQNPPAIADNLAKNEIRSVQEDGELSMALSKLTVTGSGIVTITADQGGWKKSGSDAIFESIVLNSASGESLQAALAQWSYVPVANFNGEVIWTIEAKAAESATAATKTIKVQVSSVNDAPVLNAPPLSSNDAAQVNEGKGSAVVLTLANFGISADRIQNFDPDLDANLSTVNPQTYQQIVFEVTAGGHAVWANL